VSNILAQRHRHFKNKGAQKTVFCAKCGNHLLDRALYCTNCGKANEIRILEKKGAAILAEIISKEEKELEYKYEHLQIKVSDEAFHNSYIIRQNILHNIKMHEDEFRNKIELVLKKQESKYSTVIYIYANSHLIGNVPNSQAKYLLDNWDRIERISEIEVFGGNRLLHNQYRVKYGAEITVRLHRKYTEIKEYTKANAHVLEQRIS
jgi:hypothetical protein